MLDLNGLTLLPERIIEVGGKNGLVNVVRDYCWISHIEGRLGRSYKIHRIYMPILKNLVNPV